MNLCPRHRKVSRNANGRPSKVLEFLAGDSSTCPYCSMWKEANKRKGKKKK